jgi:hypothetical protein
MASAAGDRSDLYARIQDDLAQIRALLGELTEELERKTRADVAALRLQAAARGFLARRQAQAVRAAAETVASFAICDNTSSAPDCWPSVPLLQIGTPPALCSEPSSTDHPVLTRTGLVAVILRGGDIAGGAALAALVAAGVVHTPSGPVVPRRMRVLGEGQQLFRDGRPPSTCMTGKAPCAGHRGPWSRAPPQQAVIAWTWQGRGAGQSGGFPWDPGDTSIQYNPPRWSNASLFIVLVKNKMTPRCKRLSVYCSHDLHYCSRTISLRRVGECHGQSGRPFGPVWAATVAPCTVADQISGLVKGIRSVRDMIR